MIIATNGAIIEPMVNGFSSGGAKTVAAAAATSYSPLLYGTTVDSTRHAAGESDFRG
ncbi:MAG TPA: hypothetical protein VN837_19985 [Chloroflexota bacterium]|nr:hypothetical protein [Chloroflexota bacterium]